MLSRPWSPAKPKETPSGYIPWGRHPSGQARYKKQCPVCRDGYCTITSAQCLACYHKSMAGIVFNPNELHRLYWRKGYSAAQIGKRYGISYQMVLYRMKKYGIPRRGRMEARELRKRLFWASNDEWQECRNCGTSETEHMARGLCSPCYNRLHRWITKKGIEVNNKNTDRWLTKEWKSRQKDGTLDEPLSSPPLGRGQVIAAADL